MLKGYMFIWWNAEGVHIHLSECWRGTCLSGEMQKGCVFICRNAEGVHGKKRLGTPGLPISSVTVNCVWVLVFSHELCCASKWLNLESLKFCTLAGEGAMLDRNGSGSVGVGCKQPAMSSYSMSFPAIDLGGESTTTADGSCVFSSAAHECKCEFFVVLASPLPSGWASSKGSSCWQLGTDCFSMVVVCEVSIQLHAMVVGDWFVWKWRPKDITLAPGVIVITVLQLFHSL